MERGKAEGGANAARREVFGKEEGERGAGGGGDAGGLGAFYIYYCPILFSCVGGLLHIYVLRVLS